MGGPDSTIRKGRAGSRRPRGKKPWKNEVRIKSKAGDTMGKEEKHRRRKQGHSIESESEKPKKRKNGLKKNELKSRNRKDKRTRDGLNRGAWLGRGKAGDAEV